MHHHPVAINLTFLVCFVHISGTTHNITIDLRINPSENIAMLCASVNHFYRVSQVGMGMEARIDGYER